MQIYSTHMHKHIRIPDSLGAVHGKVEAIRAIHANREPEYDGIDTCSRCGAWVFEYEPICPSCGQEA